MIKKTIATGNKALKVADIAAGYGMQISLILLFAVSFIYLYWFGNGIFFYQENKSLFIYSGEYLQEFTARPGGLLTYAANFLTQGYFSPLYGSLLVSTLVILIGLIFRAIYKGLTVTESFSLLLILLPSVLILSLQVRYEYQLQFTLGFFLTALWFLLSISLGGNYSRLIILLLFPLLYYVAGSFALIYLGMYITFSLIYINGRQGYIFPLLLIVYAVLILILFKEMIFFQPVKILLGSPFIINESTRLTVYLAILGILLILHPVIVKIAALLNAEKTTRMTSVATIIILFPLIVIVLVMQNNSTIENVLKIEKYIHRQDWDSVIRQYERTPSANIVCQYYYNLALSEKGQLCNRMFSGLQSSGPFSISLEGNREQAYRTIYFYYSIGLINEAHHLAYELMVQHGFTPENIKMLIKTEIIRGNYKVVKRYLNILGKTLHYKKWAEKYGKMLYNPQLVNSDPELGEKIRLMPREDFFITTDDSRNVDLLLKSNPENRKAFEYKIARSLLEKDIIAAVDEVSKMKGLGYTAIPKHIEEAIIAYRNYARESPASAGLPVNPETERHFIRYRSVLNTYRGNKSMIEKGMKKSEKNTFWYYLQFSTVSSDFWKSTPPDRTIY